MKSLVIFKDIRRSIFRRKGLTVLFLFSIILSFTTLVSINTLNASINITLEFTSKTFNKPDVILYPESGLFNESIISDIKKLYGVGEAEGRLRFWGGVISEKKTSHALIEGIPIKPKINKLHLPDNIWEKFKGNVCILNKDIAQRENIKPGDNITILLKGANFELKVLALSDITWVVASGSPITLTVYTPMGTLENFTRVRGYNAIYIKVNKTNTVDAEEVLDEALSYLKSKGFSVKGYVVRYLEIRKVTDAVLTLFYVLAMPILFITFIIIFFVNHLSIINEYREIGVKKSIGLTDEQIFIGYLSRNLLVTVIGLISALFIGYYLSKYLSITIIREQLGALVFEYPLDGIIRTTIVVIILVILAAIFPILRVVKLDVVTLFKHGDTVKPPRLKLRIFKRPTVKMAFRNVFRKRLRALLLLVIVSSTTIGSITSYNVSTNFVNTYKDAINKGFSWDYVIGSLNLFNNEILENVNSMENITQVEAQTWYWLPKNNLEFYKNGEKMELDTSLGDIMTIGIRENQTLFAPVITEGTIHIKPGELVITKKLSIAKGVKIGDNITLIGEIFNNKFNATLTVRGIAQVPAATQWSLIINIVDAVKIANWPNNTFNALAIKVKDDVDVISSIKTVTKYLNEKGKKVDMVFVKKDLLDQTLKILNMTEAYTNTLSTLLLLMIYVSILGVLALIIHERKREIIILETIGFTEWNIIKIMLLESIFLSIIVTLITLITIPYALKLISPVINNPIFPIWVDVKMTFTSKILAITIPILSFTTTFTLYSIIALRKNNLEELKNIFN